MIDSDIRDCIRLLAAMAFSPTLLHQAGALADDPTLPTLRAAIYEARGRAESDDADRDASA